MQMFFKCSLLLTIGLIFISCGSGSGSNSENSAKKKKKTYVQLDSVSPEFNLDKEENEFDLDDIERIEVDLFGFSRDFEVQYSKDLAWYEGKIVTYTVSKDASYPLNGVLTDSEAPVLKINKFGRFECSIQVKNNKITSLEGSCYLKIVLILPTDAKIEVYNVGVLKSKRFFAMTISDFLTKIGNATWDDDKFLVIKEFKKSYKAIRSKPKLESSHLGQVLSKFSFAKAKFKALKQLHKYVVDRENLRQMIEDKFSYFERDEALKIVGL
jgi:hypothetical protein